jgi:adenylate cyclase
MVPALETLRAWDRVATNKAVEVALAVQREQCAMWGGYDLHGDGRAAVFPDGASALGYMIGVTNGLLVADWPSDLLFQNDADTNVANDKGEEVVYERGLRVALGAHCGNATRSVDPTTGRVSYSGSVVNIAARVCGEAAAGQCLVTTALLALMRSDIASRRGHREVTVEPQGTKNLRGVKGPVEIHQVMPRVLAENRYFVNST